MSDKQPRVLFVTFEFDKYIAGGVGRVINGIVPMLREKIDLQILLLLVKKHRVYKMKNGKWSFKRYGRTCTKFLKQTPLMLCIYFIFPSLQLK